MYTIVDDAGRRLTLGGFALLTDNEGAIRIVARDPRVLSGFRSRGINVRVVEVHAKAATERPVIPRNRPLMLIHPEQIQRVPPSGSGGERFLFWPAERCTKRVRRALDNDNTHRFLSVADVVSCDPRT